MNTYYGIVRSDYLAHHGIKGQRWGIRRFQNQDGSFTPAGRRRYGVDESGNMSKRGLKKYQDDKDIDRYRKLYNKEHKSQKDLEFIRQYNGKASLKSFGGALKGAAIGAGVAALLGGLAGVATSKKAADTAATRYGSEGFKAYVNYGQSFFMGALKGVLSNDVGIASVGLGALIGAGASDANRFKGGMMSSLNGKVIK